MSDLFVEGKYAYWYFGIISKAREQPRKKTKGGDYFERHHVIPRALGGSNEKTNIVLLTAREHFICHLLLTKMCVHEPHRMKMGVAFHKMYSITAAKNQQRYTNSHFYECARRMVSEHMSSLRKGKVGTPRTEETKRKISVAKKGKPFSGHGGQDPIVRARGVITRTGQKRTLESRRRMSEARKRRISEETTEFKMMVSAKKSASCKAAWARRKAAYAA